MLLIADSGATKTDWRLIDDNGKIQPYSTIGFNPYIQTSEQISSEISKDLISRMDKDVYQSEIDIYFYGAGCSHDSMCKVVDKALRNNFENANIEVNHDLLGAARALCNDQEGIAAILGTGSNSCYYDGKEITENTSSLGYILGDEGSGAHMGKTLIIDYLNGELPKHISADFYEVYHLNKGDILEAVYRKPVPNRFLASFSKYIHQNLHDPYMKELVSSCFHNFFDRHICKYSRHKQAPMNCVGSVGFYYQEILKQVAQEKGVRMNKIIDTPIADLVKYHLK